MNAKQSRVAAAMSDTTDSTHTPAPTPKRASPKASPEFAQARLRRDIRVLAERKSKLINAHAAKIATIETEHQKLTVELAAVDAELAKGAP